MPIWIITRADDKEQMIECDLVTTEHSGSLACLELKPNPDFNPMAPNNQPDRIPYLAKIIAPGQWKEVSRGNVLTKPFNRH